MTLPRVAVAGEALVDELPPEDPAGTQPLRVTRPGGSPYNVAIGLARLGIPVWFHGAAGPDAAGDVLREHAGRSGVHTAHLRQIDTPTMRAVATIEDGLEPQYTFNTPNCAAMRWEPTADELSYSPAILHIGSIASWLSPAAEAIAGLVDQAAERGAMLSFDPNVRPALLLGREDRNSAVGRIDAVVRRAGLVKASAADLAWISPGMAPAHTAAAWSTRSRGVVLLTDGASPATAFVDGHLVARRASPTVRVRDTVGAGDAFMAAVLAELVQRAAVSRSDLGGLAADIRFLADLLDVGHAAAALTCERIGADPPTAAELDARLGRAR